MPKIEDKPSIIYVRNIDEDLADIFSQIKNKFYLNSNGDVVKELIKRYPVQEQKLIEAEKRIKELGKKLDELEYVVDRFKNSFSDLMNFDYKTNK